MAIGERRDLTLSLRIECRGAEVNCIVAGSRFRKQAVDQSNDCNSAIMMNCLRAPRNRLQLCHHCQKIQRFKKVVENISRSIVKGAEIYLLGCYFFRCNNFFTWFNTIRSIVHFSKP